ncbi:MAG: transcription initiation factor TFIID subunit TAF12 [Bacillariaceae sp.]|jgi:transcription initiation factor TFIID subunit TAF12
MSSNDQTEETQLGVALDADPGFQQEQQEQQEQEQEQNINNNYYEAAATNPNENKWNKNGFGGTCS